MISYIKYLFSQNVKLYHHRFLPHRNIRRIPSWQWQWFDSYILIKIDIASFVILKKSCGSFWLKCYTCLADLWSSWAICGGCLSEEEMIIYFSFEKYSSSFKNILSHLDLNNGKRFERWKINNINSHWNQMSRYWCNVVLCLNIFPNERSL